MENIIDLFQLFFRYPLYARLIISVCIITITCTLILTYPGKAHIKEAESNAQTNASIENVNNTGSLQIIQKSTNFRQNITIQGNYFVPLTFPPKTRPF